MSHTSEDKSSTTTLDENAPKTEREIAPMSEIRMSIGDQPVGITLIQGTAEVFGMELALQKEYIVKNAAIAVFSWHGAKIQVRGDASRSYVARSTPMNEYVNTHFALEKMRRFAKKEDRVGPRVLVVGQSDTGKSTVCRILCNYAVKSGWQPLLVDLDVGQPMFAIPGTVSCTPIEYPLGVNDLVSHGPTLPLSFFFGHTNPAENLSHYKTICKKLAGCIEKRLERPDAKARYSGVIINTCGWVDEGDGYDTILSLVESFKINVILVIDNEWLAVRLREDSSAAEEKYNNMVSTNSVPADSADLEPPALATVAVAQLSKSGGVVSRDKDARAKHRSRRIREYFYGENGDYAPRRKAYQKMPIHTTTASRYAPTTALPIGESSLLRERGLPMMLASSDLESAIMAVSSATTSDDVVGSPVCGYVHVKTVDTETRTIIAMAPTNDPPEGNRFIVGTLKWFDES